MMIENCFCELKKKYGEAFSWDRTAGEDEVLLQKVYDKIGQDHPLRGMKLSSLAKHKLDKEVLFCTEYGQFVVVYLEDDEKTSGYLRYKLLDTHQELKEYWELKLKR